MRTIEKHQAGKILSLIKKGIGVADWFVPTHLDIDSKPILEYRENRARNKYKMHKIGTYPLKECAQFVNKYFGIDKGGGSAWSHNYIVPYINGYEGIEKINRPGNSYENHFSYNLDATDNLKKKFNKEMLDKNKQYVVNMYFSGSPWDYKARSDGNSYSQGTHTGVLLFNGNKWVVKHNFHGDIMEDPMEDLLGTKNNIGITSISIPKYRRGNKLIPRYKK